MSWTEQKKRIRDRKDHLEQRLAQRFERLQIHGETCFRMDDGVIFSVSPFPGREALVVEYANDENAAKLYQFEDGDLFYLADMDEDTMLEAMLSEILQ